MGAAYSLCIMVQGSFVVTGSFPPCPPAHLRSWQLAIALCLRLLLATLLLVRGGLDSRLRVVINGKNQLVPLRVLPCSSIFRPSAYLEDSGVYALSVWVART